MFVLSDRARRPSVVLAPALGLRGAMAHMHAMGVSTAAATAAATAALCAESRPAAVLPVWAAASAAGALVLRAVRGAAGGGVPAHAAPCRGAVVALPPCTHACSSGGVHAPGLRSQRSLRPPGHSRRSLPARAAASASGGVARGGARGQQSRCTRTGACIIS